MLIEEDFYIFLHFFYLFVRQKDIKRSHPLVHWAAGGSQVLDTGLKIGRLPESALTRSWSWELELRIEPRIPLWGHRRQKQKVNLPFPKENAF